METPRAAVAETALRRAVPPPPTRTACYRSRSVRECAQGRNVRTGLSSMADVAVGELIGADAVVVQTRSGLLRVGLFAPVHIRDFLAWPQVRGRVAVAVEAKLHSERNGAVGQRHLVDPAVAFGTADTLCDVDVVAEEHVFGQHRHALPVERLILREALPDPCEHRCARPDLGMTGHAGVGRWQAGTRAGRDAGVAVAAVDAEFADVMAMAEWHWLR